MTNDLEVAHREAQHWANLPKRGGPVRIYRLLDGRYFLTQHDGSLDELLSAGGDLRRALIEIVQPNT
jgi:hypothetical protein